MEAGKGARRLGSSRVTNAREVVSVLRVLGRPGREIVRNARKLERPGTEEIEPRRKLSGPDKDLVRHGGQLGRSGTVFGRHDRE